MILTKHGTRWYPNYHLAGVLDVNELRSWLTNHNSMTQRLKQQTHETPIVQLLRQGWQYPAHDEAQMLHLPYRQKAWIREVYLLIQQQQWLYGRSVFSTYRPNHSTYHLRRLQENSLGNYLFAQPQLTRSRFVFAKLTPSQDEYQRAIADLNITPTHLWSRRSCFSVAKRSILLTETYLPACIENVS